MGLLEDLAGAGVHQLTKCAPLYGPLTNGLTPCHNIGASFGGTGRHIANTEKRKLRFIGGQWMQITDRRSQYYERRKWYDILQETYNENRIIKIGGWGVE